jgi:hypothetical protein
LASAHGRALCCVTCRALSASRTSRARPAPGISPWGRVRSCIYTPARATVLAAAPHRSLAQGEALSRTESSNRSHRDTGQEQELEVSPRGSSSSSSSLGLGTAMGKGRAPCCAKVGLNKGSWTPEEDMRLVAYIQKYGHANWRALPKQAGTDGGALDSLCTLHAWDSEFARL